jgi:hypothetical protein
VRVTWHGVLGEEADLGEPAGRGRGSACELGHLLLEFLVEERGEGGREEVSE